MTCPYGCHPEVRRGFSSSYLYPRVNSSPRVCLSPIVPALSDSATFVSGIQYQAPYGPSEQLPELLRRERQIAHFLDEPTPAKAQTLCSQGVRWLWIDLTRHTSKDQTNLLTERLKNDSVLIAELNGCSVPR